MKIRLRAWNVVWKRVFSYNNIQKLENIGNYSKYTNFIKYLSKHLSVIEIE